MTTVNYCASCGTPIRREGGEWVHYRHLDHKVVPKSELIDYPAWSTKSPRIDDVRSSGVVNTDDTYWRVETTPKMFVGIGGSITLEWWFTGGSKTYDTFYLNDVVAGDSIYGRMPLADLTDIFSGKQATYHDGHRLRIDSLPDGDFVVIRAGDTVEGVYRSVVFHASVLSEMLNFVMNEPPEDVDKWTTEDDEVKQ